MNGIQTSDTGSICPYCGKYLVVTDDITGERVCEGCGFVIDERREYSGAEWRAFSKEEYDDKTRTGSPTSLAVHDMGLAAAALYLSCVMNGNGTTQKVIAAAAGVTEVTIRNRCKGLRESLGGTC